MTDSGEGIRAWRATALGTGMVHLPRDRPSAADDPIVSLGRRFFHEREPPRFVGRARVRQLSLRDVMMGSYGRRPTARVRRRRWWAD